MGRAYSTKGGSRGAYRVLVGIYEGRKPLGRPKLRCKDNIKIYLREVGWGGTNWIGLAQGTHR